MKSQLLLVLLVVVVAVLMAAAGVLRGVVDEECLSFSTITKITTSR